MNNNAVKVYPFPHTPNPENEALAENTDQELSESVSDYYTRARACARDSRNPEVFLRHVRRGEDAADSGATNHNRAGSRR